jgi:phytoene/squalene synthetase
VGRLVLLVFEQEEETLPALSDAICTGLQLANHWQDAALDYARGRIYVPEDLMRRHGVGTWDFTTGRVSDGWRGLMAELIARTRALFERGKPLCDEVGRELRFEMRLTWLGGMSILDRIEASGGDVFHHRPSFGALDKAALAWRAWRWPSA